MATKSNDFRAYHDELETDPAEEVVSGDRLVLRNSRSMTEIEALGAIEKQVDAVATSTLLPTRS